MVYVVRDDATVRDAPTTINSIKLGTLLRATVISGEWQARNAAGYRWFKITTGSFAGDYVWERSLSPTVPPNLIFQINLDETAVSNVDVHASPQTDAPVVARLQAGQSAFVAGAVEGGWYELRLKRGGVGYALASSFN